VIFRLHDSKIAAMTLNGGALTSNLKKEESRSLDSKLLGSRQNFS